LYANIVVVDPGLKTGVVVYYPHNDDFTLLTVPFEEYTSLAFWFMPELPWPGEYNKSNTLLIVEDFTLRPDLAQVQGGNRMWSSEIIGYLRGMAKDGGVDFLLQPASAQAPDALLKSLGLWDLPKRKRLPKLTSEDYPHVRSALAHLVHYMGKEHPEWITERLDAMETTTLQRPVKKSGRRTATSVRDGKPE
jgi:hypothetical protein